MVFTVSFNSGPGTPTPPSQFASLDQVITLPAAPSYPGFTFLGWSDGVTTYPANGNYTVTGNITLDAQYGSDSSLCFHEDTKILCFLKQDQTEKYLPITSLRKGMLVKTAKHGYLPINLIGKSQIYNPATKERTENRLYRCSKEDFPELNDDLIITGAHSILVDDITPVQRQRIMESAGRIFITDNKYRLMAYLDERTKPFGKRGTFAIWHFSLGDDSSKVNHGVYANGLLVESSFHSHMKKSMKIQH